MSTWHPFTIKQSAQSQLHPVKVTDLKLDKIDLLTRSIIDKDLLQENIFIVYSDKLIGFLCLNPAQLVIDGETFCLH